MLQVVPIELKMANAIVKQLHRHHKPTVGHRFSLAVLDAEGKICGVSIIGRPVARLTKDDEVLEVTRVATDGTKNACSILLGAAARAGKAMGYLSIQTFTLPSEGGSSLRGAGWQNFGESGGGQWKHTDGKARCTDNTSVKQKWVKILNAQRPKIQSPTMDVSSSQSSLFDIV